MGVDACRSYFWENIPARSFCHDINLAFCGFFLLLLLRQTAPQKKRVSLSKDAGLIGIPKVERQGRKSGAREKMRREEEWEEGRKHLWVREEREGEVE